MKWLSMVLMSILGCILYGILHDQITARICVEYFTIGHYPIFPTTNPTLLGIGWGIVATWWVGLFLGIPLATSARLGPRPKREPLSLIRPMGVLFVLNGLFALLAGVAGLVAASRGWVWLAPRLATRVPEDRHIAFLVDLWTHNASYLGGFVGGVFLIAWIWWTRIRMEMAARRRPAATLGSEP